MKIVSTFLSTPMTMRQGESASVITTSEEAMLTMQNLFAQIKQKGWAESKIIGVDVCAISETLVFLDNEYYEVGSRPSGRTLILLLTRSHESKII